MTLYAPFNKATVQDTPKFLQAEIERANLEAKAQQEENSLRSSNLMGGAELYNEAMGDKSPIADYLAKGSPAGAAEAASLASATESAALPAQLTAGAGGTASAGIPTAAAVGAETAAATSAASSQGMLASMGPAGWAALAAMALASYSSN